MESLTFRPGTPADAELIRDLVRRCYAKWVPVVGREPLPMTADYGDALQKHRFTLAYDGADLAGLIETVAQADHLWVENIAVRPDLQGKGIGHRLLDLAEAEARAAGLPELRLLTNAAMAANVGFYQALGFAADPPEPFRGGFIVRLARKVQTPEG
jgi:ribosomal protein S18 acetylase RimI-like enzyme